MLDKHSQFMKLAIDEAWKYQLLTYPNPAVGACVVKNETVLSVQAHKQAGMPHAEVLALKDAYLKEYPDSPLSDIDDSFGIHNYLYKNHKNFFKECEIYVTLEPCNHTGKTPACAMLLESVGIKKVYIGTLDPNSQASGGIQRLNKASIEVVTGILKEQTDNLLYPFTKWHSDKFVFFKMAMREDGSVTGGYITTKDSLSLVHEIRTKIDLMVIGGETVRVDRPTLDARYAKVNKPCNILIYSHNKEFDETIPLFKVPNRDIDIVNKLDIIDQKNFVMVEGGYKMLESVKQLCDYLILFVSHKKNFDKKFECESLGFSKVYSYKINHLDEIVYLKNNMRD
ncbi:MAG: bifunctional diaminohydroxyphosphoribosylaminopyrimidine deaminase/5-amino-6-(5-phosphoribosylamino)uracil reductase RibD [Campylobacterota bacterium]|nr:bifunctional diaminohydroxyphosphoribosylaminopyrimidine deaminase/5-amino-6-(5-phosphoribosylamino)uracil reductase RibD [Campylobacterota bacterium]